MPPVLQNEFVLLQKPVTYSVALEPAHNAFNSLLMLTNVERLSGLDEWIMRTAAMLSPEQRHTNRLVVDGLYHGIVPGRRYPDFPAYVDELAARPAVALRDQHLWQISRPHMHEPASSQAASKADPATLLASVDAYLRFLEEHFAGVEIDFAMEAEAHALLNDPPRMQALVVSHLRSMWHEVLAPEWERVTPILQESAAAFQQIDFAGMPPVEAARIVLGQEIGGKWDNLFDKARQIIFVPSAHLGPYVGKFMNDQVLWLLFGARLPEGAPVRSSALNRSELLVRLSAITDDTRLRILALLSQHDELCAQELMTRLNLTQSATSRHLRQLSATGYVTEQWREGAKCYTLNRGRIDDTFRALARFLDGP